MAHTRLFETPSMAVNALPADGGPRGARVEIVIGGDNEVVSAVLLEGQARALHLALRQWIRQQKSLRGDTPRGVRKFEIRDRQYRTPRRPAEAA